jgi:3-deoxy-D-manno-octulosonate 8-phosphate phosphatase (KDO 8-P phosphatase)
MSLSPDDLHARAGRVRLLLLDVDGVLTDGSVDISSAGDEAKRFFIRDGLALVWARRAGIEVGLLSGRASGATSRRAAELGIRIVVQGNTDKRQGYLDVLTTGSYTDEDVAYMGDDLLDLPVLARAGLAAAPCDATDEVLARVHWVSRHPGGRGAVRELVELLLRSRGRWHSLVDSHLA